MIHFFYLLRSLNSFLTILIAVFPLFPLFGQLDAYTVTRTTGIAYSDISGATAVSTWRNGTSTDNTSANLPIGFSFEYDGGIHTQFRVSTEGFITFNLATPALGGNQPACNIVEPYTYDNTVFTSTLRAGTLQAIAPFYNSLDPDLYSLNTTIHYQTSGGAPNRVLTVQWRGMSEPVNSSCSPCDYSNRNFQVKLYETSNNIEFLYSNMYGGWDVNDWQYTSGINSSTMSGAPTITQLITQQTENTASFNNTPQNGLTTDPTTNSKITFTRTAPAPPVAVPPCALYNFPANGNANSCLNTYLSWAGTGGVPTGYDVYFGTVAVPPLVSANQGSTYYNPGALAASTTYYWKVVPKNGFGDAAGCPTYSFTTGLGNIAPASISSTAGTTFCVGTTTTLAVVGGNLAENSAFQWTSKFFFLTCTNSIPYPILPIDGCETNSHTITFNTAGTYTYYAFARGCNGVTSCASIVITVNNNNNSAPTGVTATPASPICAGSSTSLDATGGTLGAGATTEWFTGSCGGTPAGTGDPVSVSPAVTTTYWVRRTGGTGPCPNTTTCTSITITVQTAVGNNTVSSAQTICSGQTPAGLTGTAPTGGTGTYTYLWESSTDGVSYSAASGTNNTQNYSPGALTQTTWFRRNVSSGACAGTNSSTSAAIIITVNPVPAAAGSITGTATVCAPQNGVSYSVGAIADATGYSWSLPAGATIASGANTNAITVDFGAGATSGNITVLGTNACGSGTSSSFAVTVSTASAEPTGATAVPATLCSGGSTTLTVTGGSLGDGASWTWYTGSCGGTPAGIGSPLIVSPAGTITYYIRAEGTCNTTACVNVTVTVNTTYTASETHVDLLCNGASTGSIDITPSGGTGPYTYAWADGPTTEDRTNIPSGVYSITVTDANSCTATQSVTITQPPVALSAGETHLDVLCNGGSTGSIDITPAGGTGAYTYAWADGPTTEDRTNLASGTYTVTVNDANGCTATQSAVITQPASALSASETHLDVLCNGGNTGSIDITPGGGTGAYTYSWSDGSVIEDRTNLAANTYTVTVTDASNCTASAVVIITEPSLISTSAGNAICSGDSIFLQGAWQATAGTYNDTLSSVSGCDSIVQTILTLNPVFQINAATGICQGDSILVGGNWQTTAGTYFDTLLTVNNCDSVIITVLSVDSYIFNPISALICQGDSIQLSGGNWVSAGGIYNDTLSAVSGCDSIIQTTLTVNPTATAAATATICNGDSIFLQGAWQATAGTYYDTLQTINNCDSIIETTLTVNPTAAAAATATICSGDSIFLQANWQAVSGTYYDTLISVNGCDSIIETTLFVDSSLDNSISLSICQGDSIFLNGSWQSAGGIFYDTLQNVNGCDSILETTLIVNLPATATATATICAGDSIFLSGSWQSAGGIYYDTLQTVNGCDSIIETTLIVNPTATATATATICNGDSIFLQGNWQTVPGTYYDTLVSVNGCDSVIATSLTVNPTYYTTDPAITICNGDSVSVYGIFRSIAGTYYDSSMTINGCDSVFATTLIVIPVYNTPVTAAICSGDTIFLSGGWQSAGGIYYDTLTAVAGCDSIVETTLSVLPVSSIQYPASICNGDSIFQYPASICNGDSIFLQSAWQTTSGVFYDTLVSVNGCDSVIVTSLTVNPTYYTTDPAITICNGDSVYVYGIFRSIAGTYYDSLITVNGCDSVFATTLIVNLVYNTPVTEAICSGDTIFLSGSWQSAGGIYYDTLTAVAGCDSIVETTLSVLPVSSIQYPASICNGDSILQGVWQTTSGTYYDTLQTVNGCDSIIITTLFVNTPPIINIPLDTIEITRNETAQLNATGGVNYSWAPATGLDNPASSTPVASPAETTEYFVTGTDSNGCDGRDSITVVVLRDESVFIPNIFSPNGDNKNDRIGVMGQNIKSVHFLIFDRWGEIVYEYKGALLPPGGAGGGAGWDGTYRNKKLTPQVLVYYADVEFYSGNREILRGTITIVE
ncbi:MAG: gliding motility-associated C-terminal domain-containing protein [Bacteroidetes bacterium]|nr:gliding motility-associated C-terminal domain-containing protein [Bacteroidota bacterium]